MSRYNAIIPQRIYKEYWDELQEPYSKAMVCTCGGLKIFEFIPYAYNRSTGKLIRLGRCHTCGKLITIETKLESKNEK